MFNYDNIKYIHILNNFYLIYEYINNLIYSCIRCLLIYLKLILFLNTFLKL